MSKDKDGVSGARKALFAFFTGRQGDVSGQTAGQAAAAGGDMTGTLRSQLIAAYGTNKRGGVDTAKAAKSLGVTQRAVSYWLAGTYKPKAEIQKKIATKSRQAATTKRGRQRLAQHARAQLGRTKNKAPQLFVVGEQGPRNGTPEYLRHRITNLWQNLGPDDIDILISAWEEGGEDAAIEWLTQAFGDGYLDEWGFASIDQISFTDPRA